MNNENAVKFEQIITQAWNDYKGAVTAFTVLNKRFEEDLEKVTEENQKNTLIELHQLEKNRYTKTINNHFNYFQKIYKSNEKFVSGDFCGKINREIADIKSLLKA